MARFEVLIPAAPPEQPFSLTLRVESESWLAALKIGLQKICGAQLAENVLCDVADGSVDVTDPATGRVFRITEIEAEPSPASAPAARPAPAVARAAAGRGAPTGAAATRRAAPARPSPSEVEPAARPAAPARRPIGRTPLELRREDLLAELFLRAPRVQERRSVVDGLGYLLDLAMEKVRCDSGSAFLASGDGLLAFAVARGPKASEVMRLDAKVPMGVGVVGFCAQESVALAVSDAEKDPRFHRAVAEAVRYPVRSMLCAPVAKAGRVFGCLELMNRVEGAFDEGDLAILSYVAHQAALFLADREAREGA